MTNLEQLFKMITENTTEDVNDIILQICFKLKCEKVEENRILLRYGN